MTRDERLAIGDRLDILKKQCEMLMRSIEETMDMLGSLDEQKEYDDILSKKEKFLLNH